MDGDRSRTTVVLKHILTSLLPPLVIPAVRL